MALPAYSNPSLIEHAVGSTLPAADVNKILGMINDIAGTAGRRPAVRREWLKAADKASAGTCDLSTVEGNYVHITGTTNITAFGTVNAGTVMVLEFDGALTVTHNATSLILANGANLVTVAGTVLTLVSEGSGNWREIARNDMGGAWTTFTPTVTQGVGITITVTVARYQIIGKLAVVEFRILLSSAGTAGQDITIASIPAAIQPKTVGASAERSCGTFCYSDFGTGFRVGAIIPFSTTQFKFVTDNGTAFLGGNPALTVANADIVSGFAVYEIA